MLKKILKYLSYLFLFLIGFSIIYAIAAWGLSRITVNAEQPTENDVVSIYILTNGMHTDLVLPVTNEYYDWNQSLKYAHTLGNDTTAQWVGLGWGDQGIYLNTPTWDDLTFKTAFEAAFFLSESAIHATFFHKMTESEKCKEITMTANEYGQLVDFINESLEMDANGQPLYINTTSQYGQNDAFYEANGTYNFTHTCNTWANKGLKACGQKAALWTPFDTGIFYHYQ